MSESIEIVKLITSVDWFVFFAVLMLTIGAVVWGHRLKSRQLSETEQSPGIVEHLLMGRRLTLPLFVATLVSTWYGGIFGVTQIAFEHGIYNFLTQGVFWYLTYIIFAIWLVKPIKSSTAATLPELVGRLFGPRARRVASVFNFFNVVPIAYAVSLGLMLQALFGGPMLLHLCLGVGFVSLYSMLGGFRAVVFSDLVQFCVMCTAVLMIFVFSVSQFGGLEFLQQRLPKSHFDPTGGVGFASTLVWGIIALSTLVDPNFYHRVFAAQNSKTARRGIYLSTAVWIAFDICTTAGGMYAAAVLPGAESSGAYLTYAMQILPEGLRGLAMAGIVATILSTMDSYLFLAGTTLSYDLLPRYRESIWAHRISIFSVGVLAIVLAVGFDGNIKNIWKTLGSYSAGCLLLPVMLKFLFPQRFRERDFLLGCSFGVFAITYWRFAEHSGFWAEIDDLYAGIVATLVGLAPGFFVRVPRPTV